MVEWTAAIFKRDIAKMRARYRTSDARKGDRCANCLTHDQRLAMRLGKFIAIMAADPARAGNNLWDDGQLDCGCTFDEVIEDPKFVAMDHVLCIVQDNGLGTFARGEFIIHQSPP